MADRDIETMIDHYVAGGRRPRGGSPGSEDSPTSSGFDSQRPPTPSPTTPGRHDVTASVMSYVDTVPAGDSPTDPYPEEMPTP